MILLKYTNQAASFVCHRRMSIERNNETFCTKYHGNLDFSPDEKSRGGSTFYRRHKMTTKRCCNFISKSAGTEHLSFYGIHRCRYPSLSAFMQMQGHRIELVCHRLLYILNCQIHASLQRTSPTKKSLALFGLQHNLSSFSPSDRFSSRIYSQSCLAFDEKPKLEQNRTMMQMIAYQQLGISFTVCMG